MNRDEIESIFGPLITLKSVYLLNKSVIIYNLENLVQCISSDCINNHRALGREKLLRFLEIRKLKKKNNNNSVHYLNKDITLY